MMEKTLRDNLTALFSAYEAATGTPSGGVARRALNDNTWASKVLAGANFTINSYDRVVVWLAETWPDETPWPEGVPLPDGFKPKVAGIAKITPETDGD